MSMPWLTALSFLHFVLQWVPTAATVTQSRCRLATTERLALPLVSFFSYNQLMLNNFPTATEGHSGSTEMMTSCLVKVLVAAACFGFKNGFWDQTGWGGEMGWGLFPL